MGLKEQLLAVEKTVVRVYMPELKEPVYVRVMTGTEYEAYQGQLEALGNTISGARACLVAMTVCDETGKRIFAEANDTAQINSVCLERLAMVSMKINGLTKSQRENYEKNLPPDAPGPGIA